MAGLLNYIGSKRFSVRSNNSYFLLFTFAFLLSFSPSVNAQDENENIPENLAPPALKIISKEEKSALAGVNDIKDRTKLALDLMEARLKKAEALNSEESFADLLTELGSFQALMDDTLRFLNRNADGRGKVMSTYKRFEMSLRAFMPRLELIRREVPDNYEYHVRKLLRNVRDTRAKAVEPFFSSTVVPSSGN
jgi:hypothetical protein